MSLKFNIRRAMIILIALISIVATFFAFFLLRQSHEAAHREAFVHQADLHRMAVEEGLLVVQDVLYASKGLFESTETIGRRQFNLFSSVLLARTNYIQALEWIPIVRQSERTDFEARAVAEGLSGFQFRERRDGRMVPAAQRPEYYPVYYLNPIEGNQAAIGFDLGSSGARRLALEQARDTGEPVMTRSIRLVQEMGSQSGVLVFLPVYRTATPPENQTARRTELKGFVLLVLRVGDLISGARAHIKQTLLTRVTDARTGDILHDEITGNETMDHDHDAYAPVLDIAGRQWQFQFLESSAFPTVNLYHTEWIVLFGLLTIIILTGALMFQMERQNRLVTRTVKMRTRQLRDSEQRFALAAKGASVGIWDWFDSAADEVYFSPRFFEILGMAAPGSNSSVAELRQRVHPDDLDELENAMRDQARAGDRLDHELRILTSAGAEKWVRVAATITKPEGKQGYRRVGTIEDISQRKAAEMRASAYARDLQRSNDELEQFVYVASHDLKAPLRGIRALADWIEEGVGDAVDEDVSRYLDLLKSRIERLDALLEGLLFYARAGSEKIEPESIDLNALCDEICDLLDARSRGFIVQRDLPVLITSRIAVTQVLQNLIANAIKHHDKAGGRIDIAHEMAADHCRITITDDGPGIPAQMANRVFRMFQTLRPRDQVEGSGMGLAITRKLMDSINGEISVDTTYHGPGTRILIIIPLIAEPDMREVPDT